MTYYFGIDGLCVFDIYEGNDFNEFIYYVSKYYAENPSAPFLCAINGKEIHLV